MIQESQSNFIWAVSGGSITLFGTFGLQHIFLKSFDPLIISLAYQIEPVLSLILSMIVGIQDVEYSSVLLYAVFLVFGNMLIVAGIRQFEDKYEGGIVGMSNEQRNNIRIDHLRELQMLGIGDMSETRSKF